MLFWRDAKTNTNVYRHVKFWYLEYSRSAKYKEPVPLMGRYSITSSSSPFASPSSPFDNLHSGRPFLASKGTTTSVMWLAAAERWCVLFYFCICFVCFVFVYLVFVYLYTSVIWHGEHGEMNNNSDSCQWIWCIGGGAPNWNICFASNFTRFQYIALWWLPNGAVGGEALSALLVQPMTSQGLQHWRHQHHLHHHLHRHLQPPPSSPVPPHHYRWNPST